ncbi:30S ribosomal protein S12 methylthiotransferase RimO [Campylobacter corcagiensis]|uniref:Ribosomal protein uS12 methylthiotransferase RimO n=1 Tax=Campylobacter corcagiensis TaxID=1448857 RepID=A0A7M1LGD7_9BACT|nr:30S ribosomal protein S12 methylthiotransferase RimO [Campylobacter corcagiensis]QKF64143.1 radical SAM methylthiotransferase, MiaB/RimO family [Campylobacter corcagiensis]QOQ87662.1 30S ribosomal protein S12 methylthiotransferase RimO [Campylobacter corcagiensis]
MPNLYLRSLGCNKNLVDSEIMLGRLKAYDLTDDPSKADVMIVNTCGFIDAAKTESINAILELAQQKKDNALLVVTGCLTQRYKDEMIKELPEVDIFSGVGDYDKIDEMILKKQNLFSPQTYLQKDEKRVITGSNYHAYIKLSEGCNQRCSFCAIPTFKGRLKSRDLKSIVFEVENLVKQGFYDFSFISQDSSSYLRDFGIKDGLINLINEIEKIDGVKFARILYLYPTTTSDALIEKIISSKVFLNYFDMPIQHINDNMLKIMRRGADKSRIMALLELMRNAKNSFLRSGFIVGHPGEGEDEFLELCEFLKEFKFDRVSVFAYSKEEDTPSYEMEQILPKTIAKRLNLVEKITNQNLKENLNSMIGKEILVNLDGLSSEGEMFYSAKALIWDRDIDGEILINDSDIKDLEVGKIYRCKITDLAENKLIGEILA